MSKKKIGILTWYNHGNFGSALQAYALQTYLTRLGYDVEVIAYIMQWRRSKTSIKTRIKQRLKICLTFLAEYIPVVPKRLVNHFQYFYRRFILFSAKCTESNIAEVSQIYDTIITGSDQIWSPAHIDYTYLLNFCSRKNVRKVAYAPSFGVETMHEDKIKEYQRLLSDYDSISVREDAGARILKNLGFDSEVVLDPTLLLDAEDYHKIERTVFNVPSKFVFCYFLPTKCDYSKKVLDYAKKRNLAVIGISLNSGDEQWLKTINNAGPSEFLWLIDHAEIVITNSYHGTILSMNLGKPFFCYERFRKEDVVCENSRIYQLQNYFDISSYILRDGDNIPGHKPYPYSEFLVKREPLRLLSKNYILKSI